MVLRYWKVVVHRLAAAAVAAEEEEVRIYRKEVQHHGPVLEPPRED